MTSVAAVETRGLEKRYPKTHALRGVSLAIAPGEIFALLGPNGAGKTTWISIVCGLSRPTAGEAFVLGHDVRREAMAARRAIGLVPQEVNFDPFFSPREILRFQMGYYGLQRDEGRIDELLAAFDLSAKADANSRELSGGMKRRLLVAKALVHRPRVAFLDEPTAGVDVALRRDLWAYMRALRDEGTTIVLTTHYLEEAEALADRVAVIDKGALVSQGTPRALLARHGSKRLVLTLVAPLPPGAALPAALVEMGATVEGTRIECAVPDGDEPGEGGLPRLLAAAAQLAVVDVRTEQPTLEQVFLKLTGNGARAQNGGGS